MFQFFPQLSAYFVLGLWCARNPAPFTPFGLNPQGLLLGIKWGTFTGLLLGGMNTLIILWVVPRVGWDIGFLQDTPHANMPTWFMVPWGILGIAIGVELNFRGFLLGRLETLFRQWFREAPSQSFSRGTVLAVGSSALIFAFDPFMVITFQHLHWIAVWDGLVWGWLFVRMRNLYVVIVAHAVEVMILYLSVKAALI